MSKSRQKELIGTLWIIAALLAFGFGYTGWGWCFAIKGASDQVCSICCAIKDNHPAALK